MEEWEGLRVAQEVCKGWKVKKKRRKRFMTGLRRRQETNHVGLLEDIETEQKILED